MNELVKVKKELKHHGILGQKWGIRRYQNPDGTLTPAGYSHYGYSGHRNNIEKLGEWEDEGQVVNFSYEALSEDYTSLKKSKVIANDSEIAAREKTSNASLDKILKKEESGIPSKDMDDVDISTVNNDFWNSLAQHQMRKVKNNSSLLEVKNALKHPEKLTNAERNSYFSTICKDVTMETYYRNYFSVLTAEKSGKSLQHLEELNKTISDAKAGYFVNCPMNSLVTEMRCRGYNATAGNIATAHDATGLTSIDSNRMYEGISKSGSHAQMVSMGKIKDTKIGYSKSYDDVLCLNAAYRYTKPYNASIGKKIDAMTFRPNERYIAYWRGHISNAYTDASGKLLINDGQPGLKSMKPSEYMQSANFGGGVLVRVDDKKLNTEFIKQFTGGTYNNSIVIKD